MSERRARDRWRRAFWVVPPLSLALSAAQLVRAHYPTGHDSNVHVNTAVALAYLLRHAPGDAGAFLRTNLIHWPPLAPLLTAPLFQAGAGVWAFHAVTLLFDVVFVVFFALALRRLAGEGEAALLGLLAVLACPQWPGVSAAYNLEAPVAAATAFVVWAAVVEGRTRSWLAAAGLGLTGGALLLTKTVILPVGLLPLIWVAGRAWARRADGWRTWGQPALFLALVILPAAAWHLPAAGRAWTALTSDAYGLQSVAIRPWWWYARQLLTNYGALPLFFGFLVVAPTVRWRAVPPAAAALALGAVVSLVFFSAIGSKRAFYPLPSYILLVAALAAAWPRAEHRFAAPLRRALLVLYAAMSILVWLPRSGDAIELLSLGSAAPFEGERRVDFRVEERMAAEAARVAAGREMGLVTGVNLTGLAHLNHVETIMALTSPPFALVNDLLLPLADTLQRLPRSCFLLMIEKRHGPHFTLDSLMVQGPSGLTQTTARLLEQTLDRQRPQWREVSRLRFSGFTVGVYENARNLRLLPAATTPAIYLDYLYVDDLPRLLATCQHNMRTGDYAVALSRYRLARQFHPGAPGGYIGMIEALPHVVGPAAEAAELTALAREVPPWPPAWRAIVARLRELAAAGESTARPVEVAAFLLAGTAANDPGRLGVAGQLFDYQAEQGADEAALALAERETQALPPDWRVEALWGFAESARARGRRELAAAVYQRALREPDLPPTRTLAQLRLATLTPSGEAPPAEIDAVADERQAREATRALVARSAALRAAGRQVEALALTAEPRPWLKLCPICAEELRLEQARALLQGGAAAEAARLLRTIRVDPDLRRLAQDLLAAPPRP